VKLKKNLYLLHEVANREVEAKLYFASIASQYGYRTYVLERNFFLDNLEKFKSGIVLYKSLVSSDIKIIDKIKSFNHIFVCIDEEGILQWLEEFRYKLRISKIALEKCDKLFVIDQNTKNKIKKFYKISNFNKKCVVSGYPRVEYLKYFSENFNVGNHFYREIKKKYGKFVFFTSSMMTNHLMGKETWVRLFIDNLKKKKVKAGLLKFASGVWKLYSLQIKKQTNLLNFLSSELKDINFLVRPHPTENSKVWKDNFKKNNIFFDERDLPSHYYNSCAICTIQYGSTISFESFVQKKISIEYSSKINKKHKKFELKDHKQFVFEFDSKEDVLRHIKQIQRSNQKNIEFFKKKEKKYKFVENNLNASLNIIKELNRFNQILKSKPIKINIFFLMKKNLIYKYFLWVYSFLFLSYLFPQKIFKGKFVILKKEYRLNHLKYFEYRKNKQKKIGDEVINFVKNMSKKLIKKNFSINRIYRNNFLIEN